ncbi:MAG: phosphate transport system ATP-binding protein, partial [Actinomycetota bacterium]|nr:phosphate transport system ATP-binding protein [Actinomycetota bacterium]
MAASFEISNLSAWYGNRLAIEDISLSVEPNQVTALIGPSGSGKSTLVRCLNRLHELLPGARAEGKVILDGENIYDDAVDAVSVRRAVGMVFQRPNPFPTMSILDNTIAGFKLNGRKPKAELQ